VIAVHDETAACLDWYGCRPNACGFDPRGKHTHVILIDVLRCTKEFDRADRQHISSLRRHLFACHGRVDAGECHERPMDG
jgi:hypothetical protein